MKNYYIAYFLLVAVLTICSQWLMCVGYNPDSVNSDQIRSEGLHDSEVPGLVMSLMDRLSVTMSIEGIVGSYQSDDRNRYLIMHPEIYLERRKMRPGRPSDYLSGLPEAN